MSKQNLREIYEENFLCVNLYKFIINDLSMYLSYKYNQKDEDRIDEYKDEINGMLQYTNMDDQLFNDLLDEYIDQYRELRSDGDLTLEQIALIPTEREHTPVETYILNYRKILIEKIKEIPNSLDKAKDLLLGLISAYYPKYYSDQVYDAIVLLKEEISSKKIKSIRENWEKDAIHHFKSGRPSRFFWISNVENETLDMISRYRFKDHFNIKEFEFVFEVVESQLEELILSKRWSSLGAFDLWLISRNQNLSYKLEGIGLKLREYVRTQHEDGYWRDGSRLSITTPDIYATALITLSFLKLSPSKEWRQSGIKGARWIQTMQNNDGSWSLQFLMDGEIKSESDTFTTILCLEVLKSSGLDNTEEIIEKGENWIMTQQDDLDMWIDDFFPFPFLTVIVLEYFYNKGLFSHRLPLFQDDLTPANIIFLGMKKAIEISKDCESEQGRISPKVGAVVIKDDQIFLKAYRGETSSGDHAEYIILEKKGKNSDLKDSILVTTLEPCTSRSLNKIPCARRIVAAGIKEIWIGMLDPNPQIRGRGVLYLTNHGISVGFFPPLLSKEIKDVNNEFWDYQNRCYNEDITNSKIDIMASKEEGGK